MDAFGRMMAGVFLVQKMLVLQLCASKWIRSSCGLEIIYIMKKNLNLFAGFLHYVSVSRIWSVETAASSSSVLAELWQL